MPAKILKFGRGGKSAVAEAPDPYERTYRDAIDTDRNGSISVDELTKLGAARSRAAYVPLASMLRTELRLVADAPELASYQQRLARSLVNARGTANDDDVNAAAATLTHLPVSVLMGMKSAGLSVTVCRSVLEYLPQLSATDVRGHGNGDSWKSVPGTISGYEVVITTVDASLVDPKRAGERVIPPRGVGHGAYDLLLHELGHALHHSASTFASVDGPAHLDSASAYSAPAFLAARTADWDRLDDYFKQDGQTSGSGADETYAESFARFYGRDPAMEKTWPSLYRYWNERSRTGAGNR